VGISQKDRRHHFYAIGKTGMGKSTMLENMIVGDILAGNGVGVIDPHGDLAEKILEFIPKHRVKDVIYFNPADEEWPFGYNLLENKNSSRHYLASAIVSVFYKTWADSWGLRLEHLLRNTILALLECDNSTLLGAHLLLVNRSYREKVINKISDPIVKSYWQDEFEKYPERFLREVISPLQNKLGALLSNAMLRNIIGQKRSALDLEMVLQNKQIFIANLSKGTLGEDASHILGAMLVTQLQLAAMSQAKIEESKRQDFYLYIDEFQNFATTSFADILSEARKYRLNLIIAHQYLEQLEKDIKNAVIGNVGTIVTFRVGAEDAQFLENEFQPHYSWLDIVNLYPYEVYYKLMKEGKIERPYPAMSLPPVPDSYKTEYKEKTIKRCRQVYCKPKDTVERKIKNWLLNPVA
jgi:hypothetical protein